MKYLTLLIFISNGLYANITFKEEFKISSVFDVNTILVGNESIKSCVSASSIKPKSKSLKKVELLVQRMNLLFNEDIVLGINYNKSSCDLKVPIFQATGDQVSGKKIISVCEHSFISIDNGKCGSDGEDHISFVIAHEFAHHLIGTDENFDYESFGLKQKVATTKLGNVLKQEILSNTKFKDEPFDDLIETKIQSVEHEYVDALAAKILKELGYSEKIFSSIACMDKLYTTLKLSTEHSQNRTETIKKSYLEGWSDWKDYRSLFTLEKGSLTTFIETRNLNSIAQRINTNIDTQIEINHELKRRVMRYKSDLVTFEMEN